MDAHRGLPLERLVRAILAWPWARPVQLAGYASLPVEYVCGAGGPALQAQGWIEALTLPEEPDPRWALTAAGAALLGRPWIARASAAAWLRALHLDRARDLVLELTADGDLLWSQAPFTLPLAAVYGSGPRRRPRRGTRPGGAGLPALRPLQADALWAWRSGSRGVRYQTAWLWIDPGDVALEDALAGALRGLALWRRRREWRPAPALFPMAVIVAANLERQQRLWRLWRDRVGGEPIGLRLCARADLALPLARRAWQTQRGDLVGWGGGSGATQAPLAPWVGAASGWGARPAGPKRSERRTTPGPVAAAQSLRVWCAWQARAVSGPAALVALQRVLSPAGHGLVRAIGHYPLSTARELAVILARDPTALAPTLRALVGYRLVRVVQAGGYGLTRLGVDWLAAQYGWSGARYARLRRWPGYGVTPEQGYSVAALTAIPEHTALVKAFFIGLLRSAARAGLWLEAFDYRNCWLRRSSAAGARYEEHLIPDGIGRLQDATGRVVELWLEVDRGTGRGRRLSHKFRRHYLDGRGLTHGVRGRLVVILVERGAERRLQHLRQLIQRLDAALGVRLPVRLARVDQLTTDIGLDPTRPVWRDAYTPTPGPLLPDGVQRV